jgi:hypothetical protein
VSLSGAEAARSLDLRAALERQAAVSDTSLSARRYALFITSAASLPQ